MQDIKSHYISTNFWINPQKMFFQILGLSNQGVKTEIAFAYKNLKRQVAFGKRPEFHDLNATQFNKLDEDT